MVSGEDIISGAIKIGEIISQPIIDKWFYWAMLTYILHHKDWKYANFKIAIYMWIVHSLANIYPKLVDFKYFGMQNKPYDFTWKYKNVPPFIFLFISEIIGDWYMYFILKKMVSRNKSMMAGILCFISNLSKLYISFYMFTNVDDCDYVMQGFEVKGYDCFTRSKFWVKYSKLEISNICAVALYYGVCFILLFNSDNQNQTNSSSFKISKLFRNESKYRMMFSCICAEISFLFGIPFIIDTYKKNFNFRLEVTREAIMSITYYMIYIDQILKSEQNNGQSSHGSTSNHNYIEDSSYKKRNYSNNASKNNVDAESECSYDDKKSFGVSSSYSNHYNSNYNNNY